ncbi:MAG: endopeptidase, partial [Gaiellales bacterium]|nr:endopeptidase [Gaiellales bacterium]
MGVTADGRDERAVAAGGPDPLRQAEARAYQRAGRRRGRLHRAALAPLALLAMLGGARISSALGTPGPEVLAAAVYAWAATAALWLAGLPFALAGERAARRAGLSSQRLPGWFADQAKGLAISMLIAPPALWGIVVAVRHWPHGWWLPVTIGSIALELIVTVVAPVVIVPLFLRSHPLPPGPLADDLHALAARAGVHVRALRVLEASAKLTAANAFVAGIGPTRRIVLFDNLLGEDPDTERQIAETRSVLAHEFGHHASGDLWRLSAASAAATALALAAVAAALTRLPEALSHRSAGAFAMLPALFACAAVTQFVTRIALGAYSRRRERAADAYGIALIGDGEPFARALEGLCATNLAELRPPRLQQWLGAGHPPPWER